MVKVKYVVGTVVLSLISAWPTDRDVTQNPELIDTSGTGLNHVHDFSVGHRDSLRRIHPNLQSFKWHKSNDGKVYVPYVMDQRFSDKAKTAFLLGLVLFHISTCVRFIDRTNEKDFVHIQPSDRCSSVVGRVGGAQTVALKFPDCFHRPTLQHELLHALGFNHEQNREDRDRHVRVLWENISPRNRADFVKQPTLNQETPYDYSSVMHYGRRVASQNGLPTLLPLVEGAELGSATAMSYSDVERVNMVYCHHGNHQTLQEHSDTVLRK